MIQAAAQSGKSSEESSEPLLQVAALGHGYSEGGRRRAILHDVAFEMHAGECVALLGRSGSGKSTLLDLLGGIAVPDDGRILVGGHELTAMSERERTLFRRRHVGFIQQDFNLLPTLTVAENLLLPLELNGRGSERADTLLADVGLADRAASYPDRLSGGEQQRIAIARALVHDPLLVLADEPTGNLDAATGRAALALLTRLARASGGMLLIVTHSRAVAEGADRVLTLADGRLHAGDIAGVAW